MTITDRPDGNARPNGTASLPAPPLGRHLALIAAVAVASIALPFTFLPMQVSWSHFAFHVLGIAVCVVGVLALRRLRGAADSRALRVLTWVCSVGFVGWAIGHLGELAVVLTHGGIHTDEHIFEHPVHTFFATIAIPSWMFTVVTSLALLITAAVLAIVRRGRAAREARAAG